MVTDPAARLEAFRLFVTAFEVDSHVSLEVWKYLRIDLKQQRS